MPCFSPTPEPDFVAVGCRLGLRRVAKLMAIYCYIFWINLFRYIPADWMPGRGFIDDKYAPFLPRVPSQFAFMVYGARCRALRCDNFNVGAEPGLHLILLLLLLLLTAAL